MNSEQGNGVQVPSRRASRWATLGQWLVLGSAVGVVSGAASALFLWLLDKATAYRTAHNAWVYALPVAGLAIGWAYQRFGASIRAGNSLVIDTIHDDGPEIPLRMAPMVLLGTVATHFFGGSAGREGTAVQMGASLSDWLSHRLRLRGGLRTALLSAGVAGGFGSVFGTPIAGAIFGMEFVVLGRMEYDAFLPSLVAAFVGDLTTRSLGIVHTRYPPIPGEPVSLSLLGKWLMFAAAVAAVTAVFIELTHFIRRKGEQILPSLPVRMFFGGLAVLALWRLSGTDDYLGLGIPTLLRAFVDPALPVSTFAWKLAFTALTLGSGFIGGEVTPLFFIGAALGNALSRLLHLPLALGAGVGMASVFAAASNAPLALSVMAVEILGAGVFPHVIWVCVWAYLLSGHRGIYPAQRVTRAKAGEALEQAVSLRDFENRSNGPR